MGASLNTEEVTSEPRPRDWSIEEHWKRTSDGDQGSENAWLGFEQSEVRVYTHSPGTL